MHTDPARQPGFKRQVVFRIGAEDWPLLEAAAAEHGSLQAAIIAGLHALATSEPASAPSPPPRPQREVPPAVPRKPKRPAIAEPTDVDPDEEIRAREAAQILGLTTGTVSGYIRSRRLPGRYDAEPTRRGWVITRRAVAEYAARRGY